MDSVLLYYSGVYSCLFISGWEADLCWLHPGLCLTHPRCQQEKEGGRRRRCLFLTLHPVLPLFCSAAQAGLSMAKFSLAALPKLSPLRSLAESITLVLKAHIK